MLLFGALGSLGSYGYFFWKNREMCPCAATGLDGADGIEVAEPYSQDRITRRAVTFGAASAGAGFLLALIALAPRLKKPNDDLE